MIGRSATPSIRRRLLGLVYEALLLLAVVLLAGSIATGLLLLAGIEKSRWFTQTIVALACGGYFAWQWSRGGQTLPMKTWRMRLEAADNSHVSMQRAGLRAMLATAGYLLFGISVWWAFVDRDRQFLHDRLAGTRLASTG